MKKWPFMGWLAGIGLLSFASSAADGQAFPSKPIRIVVPFTAGGAADILARIVGDKFAEMWNRPIVIDNRAGAAGNIAAEIVAKSPPDGYTLLMGSMGTQAMNVSLYRKLPFDPARDFAPISVIAKNPNLLAAHPSVPVATVKQLIAFAKAHPGKLNYSSSGAGSMGHMSTELFRLMTGVKIVHVPYKGGAPAVTAVMSGEADVLFIVLLPILPHVKAGRLKAIAMGSRERHALLPEVPTVIESGLPGFEVRQWYGLLAPAGTPREIVTKLHAAVDRIV
ncbi:MAG: tripartite tricarboxylate transporter substrate binding protein, partial [Betaproteobacteria bacterium]|nr:tripartite tricarboxylate transporter substrate binding protein [Betaproteobacteria bacterium]